MKTQTLALVLIALYAFTPQMAHATDDIFHTQVLDLETQAKKLRANASLALRHYDDLEKAKTFSIQFENSLDGYHYQTVSIKNPDGSPLQNPTELQKEALSQHQREVEKYAKRASQNLEAAESIEKQISQIHTTSMESKTIKAEFNKRLSYKNAAKFSSKYSSRPDAEIGKAGKWARRGMIAATVGLGVYAANKIYQNETEKSESGYKLKNRPSAKR